MMALMKAGAIAVAVMMNQCSSLTVSSGMWGPPDLKIVENALKVILSNPHLTPQQLLLAKNVSTAVREDIKAVTHDNLKKDMRKQKVAHAIKLLTSLEHELAKTEAKTKTNLTALASQKATLEKELKEKKAELAKDQAEIKLATLEKDLAEKKLQLETLVAQKMKAQSAHKSDEEEMSQQSAMVSNLVNMAKNLKAAKASSGNDTKVAVSKHNATSGALQTLLLDLEARAHNVSEAISKIDAAEKANEVALSSAAAKKVPVSGKDDALAKGQTLFKTLEKEEHRKYEKAKALKKAELAQLKEAIKEIKSGDVANLKKTVAKMQSDLKQLSSKSGKFLY